MSNNEIKNDHGKPENKDNQGNGPKYFVNFEGKDIPWEKDTITTEELINLCGINPSEGIIEIDMVEQTEVTLQPKQIVNLKPGFGFAKKVKFKRG